MSCLDVAGRSSRDICVLGGGGGGGIINKFEERGKNSIVKSMFDKFLLLYLHDFGPVRDSFVLVRSITAALISHQLI